MATPSKQREHTTPPAGKANPADFADPYPDHPELPMDLPPGALMPATPYPMQGFEEDSFEWRDVNTVHDWEEAPKLVGLYGGSETVDVDGRPAELHTMHTTAGAVRFWGSAVLDRRLTSALIGIPIRITYLGKTDQGGGKTLREYLIEEGRLRK